jgi:hypothetical protein
MGQIIHLVAPSTAYPDTTDQLQPAESVLLLANPLVGGRSQTG